MATLAMTAMASPIATAITIRAAILSVIASPISVANHILPGSPLGMQHPLHRPLRRYVVQHWPQVRGRRMVHRCDERIMI